MHLIELDGLSRNFGPIEAVRRISFSVSRGEVLGFLGPNGAGKSTTMKMLAGFLTPSAGTARICGHDVVTDGLAARRRLGYLPEGAPSYPDMTPLSFLRFIARMRGADQAAVDRAAGLLDLGAVLHQPIDTLSKGYKRRVGLAQALLHDPEVLILDEPTDGLDPNQKHQVRALIKGMAENRAIIVSTHILEEVDAVCTRAMVIAAGQVLVDGTPAELEARSRYHNAIYIRAAEPFPPPLTEALQALPALTGVEPADRPGDTGLYLFPKPETPAADAVRTTVSAHGIVLEEWRVERGRLDSVFRDITGQAA
jgi:ABC-2 type transport system ATP-binding protein